MKNVLYFTLKPLLRYLNFRPDKKGKVNFSIYDVANWKANNYNIYIVQYLKK